MPKETSSWIDLTQWATLRPQNPGGGSRKHNLLACSSLAFGEHLFFPNTRGEEKIA